ncbi:ABC transporter permease [Fusibacter sp. JL216-2]|uniref:ABC transporter permease n=1 Tax=Fusibacter sp. JL216-2 TaxID=3071453 RepID=UPI003D33C1C9
MSKYILKRLLHMIPVILVISICIFGIIKLAPGSPVGTNLDPRATPEQKAMEKERLGLDKPLHIQYTMWLSRVAQGDLGKSFIYQKPVKDVIGPYLKNTFILNIPVFILAFGISIPVGIHSAVKRYSIFDNFWTVFSLVGISIPSFFFALLLIYTFAVKIQILPINGMVEAGSETSGFAYAVEVAQHMVLPGIVLTIASLASYVRYTRNGMLEVINQDYIRTARAKGLNEKVVIYKHGFRNALLPIVTLLGYSLIFLLSGSVITETVFNWPGMGRVLLESVTMRDYNLMMAVMMLYAILTLIGNLLADIGYALVDPRVKVD